LPRLGVLLLLDTIRWGSSFFLFAGTSPQTIVGSGMDVFSISLAMPLVFAVVAWRMFREAD
jgi:hypothetical protein